MSNSDSLHDPSSTTGPNAPAMSRRGLASAAVGAAAGAAALGAARAAPAAAGTRITLRREADSGVSARDLPLDGLEASGAGGPAARSSGAWRTPVLATDRFALLGVTWAAGSGRIRARVRRAGGGWEPWRTLPHLHDLPDRDTGEGRRTPHATEPVWVGGCDAVQVEVSGAVRRPVLSLVDPGRARGVDEAWVDTGVTAGVAGRRVRVPKVRSRRAWGAKEKWASGRPKRVKRVQQIHVHHTATGNDYRKREVAGVLRAIYRYHTKSLGWSDIGYNFLVDRFGRIWAGRRLPEQEIRGAHTLGFNHTSVGVAVLGNFELTAPTPKVLAAVARVAAWKLSKYGGNPLGTVAVRSRGSDRYPKGAVVTLPVIDGHRDTNQTSCPGRHLYAQLPQIRARTARKMGIVPQRTSS